MYRFRESHKGKSDSSVSSASIRSSIRRGAASGRIIKPNQLSTRSVSTGSNGSSRPRRSPYSIPGFEKYGKHCFSGRVADSYLKQHGSSAAILKDPSWVKDKADLVAAAVLDW